MTVENSKNVLKIVAELIADKQGRSVSNVDIDNMTNEEANRILEVIKEEKKTTGLINIGVGITERSS